MDWDEREDNLDELTGTNKIRHSMECPNCRSRTWSFCCFIPDFEKGKITEGCNECNKRAKKIWDRENLKISSAVTLVVLGMFGLVGFIIGYVI